MCQAPEDESGTAAVNDRCRPHNLQGINETNVKLFSAGGDKELRWTVRRLS